MAQDMIAPAFGISGGRFDTLAAILSDQADATAEAFATSRTAALAAFCGAGAAMLAQVSREKTADLFAAIAVRVRNAGAANELDNRRVARAASELFEEAQRRGQ